MSHLNNDQIKPAFDRNTVSLWLMEYGSRFYQWTDCNIHIGKRGHIGVIPGLVVKSDDLSGNGEKLDAILDTLEVWNLTEGRSIYIAPNPMKGDTRGKDHVRTYAANWVDIDCCIDRVGEALEIVKALPVAPSLVLMSGNGLQLQ